MNLSRFLLVAGATTAAVLIPACGDPTAPMSVEVKVVMDGAPVEGATISIVAKEGGQGRIEGGFTDSKGIAKVSGPKGTYKVSIKKNETVSNTAIDPKDGNKAMIEMMKKNMGKGGAGKGPMMGPTGPPKSAEPKNLLPGKYASAETSGLTLTIPPDKSPVEFTLTK